MARVPLAGTYWIPGRRRTAHEQAMSYLLTCPNCGVREVTDFGYGGEIAARPKSQPDLARAEHLQLLPPQRRRASSASGGTTAPAAGRGSSPSATRAPTRSSGRRCPATPRAQRAQVPAGTGGDAA